MENIRGRVCALIAAAGQSTRMAGVCPEGKLLLTLCGRPVLLHTLRRFEMCEAVDDIVVVTRQQDIEAVRACAVGITKLRAVVPGGAVRQESVANGLAAVPQGTEIIAIHDGARPFIEEEIITEVVSAAREYGGAAAAVPVKDTLKCADADGFITKTVDRSTLWAAQTPQAFRLTEYRTAMARATAAGKNYTDDCQLFEAAGLRVKLVQGSGTNWKLTTPDDVGLAEGLLRREAAERENRDRV